jgi:hypothetical protein
MKVYGIEIEDAIEIPCVKGSIIERKNKRRRGKLVKIPAMYDYRRIRSVTLKKFVWLLKQMLQSGRRPDTIDNTILEEVIMKKLDCSRRTAFDYRCAMEYLGY